MSQQVEQPLVGAANSLLSSRPRRQRALSQRMRIWRLLLPNRGLLDLEEADLFMFNTGSHP